MRNGVHHVNSLQRRLVRSRTPHLLTLRRSGVTTNAELVMSSPNASAFDRQQWHFETTTPMLLVF
jgi:hypothetical protein